MMTAQKTKCAAINLLELQPLLAEYEKLKDTRDTTMAMHSAATAGITRNQIGKDIADINLQIKAVKQRLYQLRHGDGDVNFFRATAFKLLPRKVYMQLLEEARRQVREKNYVPLEKIDLFSDEEYALLENAKQSEADCRALRKKIAAAKAQIQELMPNMIGVSDNDEYNSRLATIKMLTKIMKEL